MGPTVSDCNPPPPQTTSLLPPIRPPTHYNFTTPVRKVCDHFFTCFLVFMVNLALATQPCETNVLVNEYLLLYESWCLWFFFYTHCDTSVSFHVQGTRTAFNLNVTFCWKWKNPLFKQVDVGLITWQKSKDDSWRNGWKCGKLKLWWHFKCPYLRGYRIVTRADIKFCSGKVVYCSKNNKHASIVCLITSRGKCSGELKEVTGCFSCQEIQWKCLSSMFRLA